MIGRRERHRRVAAESVRHRGVVCSGTRARCRCRAELTTLPIRLVAGRLSAEEIAAVRRADCRDGRRRSWPRLIIFQLLGRAAGERSRRLGTTPQSTRERTGTGKRSDSDPALTNRARRIPMHVTFSESLKESNRILEAADMVLILVAEIPAKQAMPKLQGDRGRLFPICGGTRKYRLTMRSHSRSDEESFWRLRANDAAMERQLMAIFDRKQLDDETAENAGEIRRLNVACAIRGAV